MHTTTSHSSTNILSLACRLLRLDFTAVEDEQEDSPLLVLLLDIGSFLDKHSATSDNDISLLLLPLLNKTAASSTLLEPTTTTTTTTTTTSTTTTSTTATTDQDHHHLHHHHEQKPLMLLLLFYLFQHPHINLFEILTSNSTTIHDIPFQKYCLDSWQDRIQLIALATALLLETTDHYFNHNDIIDHHHQQLDLQLFTSVTLVNIILTAFVSMIKQLETEAITTSTTTTNNMEHDYNTSPSNSGEDRLKLGLSMVDEYIKALLKTCSRFCKGDISDGPGDHREALVQKQQRIEAALHVYAHCTRLIDMTVYASRISKHTRLLSHPFSLLKHTLGPLLRTSIITSNTVDVDDHSASVINLSCVLLYRIAGYIESAFGGRGVIGGVGGTATVNSSSTTILFLLFSKSFPTTIQWITHIHEFIHIMIVIFTESSSKTTTLSSQFSLTSSSTHHHNHHHHRRPSLRRGRSRIILSHAIIPQWVQWALSVQHIPKMCQVFLIPVLRLLVIQPDSSIITGDGNGGRGEGGDGDDDMTNHDTAIALVSSIVMNSGGADSSKMTALQSEIRKWLVTSACVRVSNRHKIQSQQQDDHHNFSGSGDDRLFAIKCLSEVSFVGKDIFHALLSIFDDIEYRHVAAAALALRLVNFRDVTMSGTDSEAVAISSHNKNFGHGDEAGNHFDTLPRHFIHGNCLDVASEHEQDVQNHQQGNYNRRRRRRRQDGVGESLRYALETVLLGLLDEIFQQQALVPPYKLDNTDQGPGLVERESFGWVLFHITHHIMNKCPLVLSPQHSINSSKKLIDSAIYKTYQRFFTQLSQRLVSAETASTATFGVDDVFTEFDARAAASKGTGFWSLRQTIAFIVAGILGYRPGNNSNNIKKKTSSSLDPHQQDTCSTDWVSSASYYTVCDDKLLRIAAPLLFHLRKDAAWAVRAVVLDLALDYVSAIHSIQDEDTRDSLVIIYRICRGNDPFSEEETSSIVSTYPDPIDTHPLLQSTLGKIFYIGRSRHGNIFPGVARCFRAYTFHREINPKRNPYMNDEIGGRYDRYSQQDYRSKSIEDELKKRRVRFEGEDSIEKDAPSFSSASVLKASINNTESFLHKSTTNTTATVATNTDVHVVGNQYLSNSRGFTTSPTSNQPSFPANAVPPVNHHDHQDPQQYEDTFSRFSSQVHQAAQRLEDIATPRTNHRRTGTITEEKFEEMRSSMDNNNHEIGNNAVLNSQLLEPYLIGGTSASLSFVAESNHYPPESSSTSPSHIRSYPCQPAGSPIDNQAVLQHAAIFAGTSDRSPSIMASNSSSRSDSKPSSTPPVFKSSTPPHHQTLNPSKTQQPQQQQSPHARLHTPESASVEHSDIDRIFARVAASALRNQDQLTSKANNNQKNSNSPLKPSSVKSTPSPQKTQHQQPRSSSTYNVEAHISVNTQNLGDVTDQIVPPSSAPPKFVAAAPVSLHSSLYKTTSSCSKNTSPVSSTSNIKSNINHHHSVHEHPLPHLLYNQQPSSFDGGEMKLEEIMIEGEEDNEHIAKANLTALLRHGSSHGKFVLVGESAKIDLQTVSARHFSFGFDEVITPDHSRPASQQPLRGIGVPVSALFSTENDGFSSSASNILMDRAVGGDRSVWRKDAVVCEKVVGGEEDGDVVVSAMDETTAPSISAIERGGVGLDGDDDIEEDDDGSIFKIGNKAANSTMLTGSFAAVSENNLVSRSNNKNILHDANTGTDVSLYRKSISLISLASRTNKNMSFGSAPIKTSLQAAAEVLLSELYFDQNRHVAVDYGRRLNRRGVLQIVPEVLKESLHPVLISVFKLDINLMLLLCGGLIFPTALQPFAVGTKGGQRIQSLVEAHKSLLPVSRIVFDLEGKMKTPLTTAQALIIVRDQADLVKISLSKTNMRLSASMTML